MVSETHKHVNRPTCLAPNEPKNSIGYISKSRTFKEHSHDAIGVENSGPGVSGT